ncbi:hypothetical protein C1646_763543 [Rhizophagus diaphanus]|nr:hypothetical protein C1646_763543 [Rhizophagus diaphanus] [Rhizophagus sp. MUCL 43196]
MQHIKDEIRIKVFIVKNPLTKSEWLIIRYGETSALFCVIRLDPTFVLSRYSIQRLLLNIDNDQEHNAFQQEVKSLWKNNLPFVLTYLLNEKYNGELFSKINDVKLVHFLSAGPNIFTPFPLRLKELQLEHGPVGPYIHQQSITEEYPSKNGDKNLAKPFDFLGQVSFQARPVTVLMLRVQPLLRNINQRIQNQPGRLRIRRRQLNAQINNEDTIYRLTNLPQQPIINNPFIDSFFQGTSFQ